VKELAVTTIDLCQDAIAIRAMLTEAVRTYVRKHLAATTAKNHPPVTRIDMTFSLGDSQSTPWVHLNFDTKPGSEPDGDPSHWGFGQLERDSWLPAVQAVCDAEKVEVVQLDGKTRECDAGEFGRQIGDFLVSMLKEARAAGLFAALPRAERCELGVEDPTSGEFGWPNYEDRGKENLA
jgi:hypothetical protein